MTNYKIKQHNRAIVITLLQKSKSNRLPPSIQNELSLETFPVNDAGSALVVFLLCDPHGSEGGERSKDGSSDPDRVLPLGRSNHFNLHGGGSKSSDLLLHPVCNTGVHGGSSREDTVSVQIFPDVDITPHNGVKCLLVNSRDLHTQEGGLEESFRSPESLVTNSDDLSVRELVRLLEGAGAGSSLHLLIVVKSDVAELLLDVSDDLPLGGGGEGVTSLGEDLHEVVSQITSSQVKTHDGVRESVSFIDRNSVGYSISRVHDNTGGSTRGVQSQHSLDSDVESRTVESLEHDLGHLLSVSLGVEGGFSQHGGMFLGGDTELVVEGVMPDLFHIIPVGDDSVLDGVLQGEDTSLALGLVSNIGILVSHTDHDTLMSWSSDDRREDSSGSIISGKTSLVHSGSIVDNNGGGFFVIHVKV